MAQVYMGGTFPSILSLAIPPPSHWDWVLLRNVIDILYFYSDIDLVVDTRNSYSRARAGIWAQQMEGELIKNRITKPTTTAVHANARVPIVTYIDSKYLIGVDISFTTNGLANTEYVRRELDERPYMRIMIILLKYW